MTRTMGNIQDFDFHFSPFASLVGTILQHDGATPEREPSLRVGLTLRGFSIAIELVGELPSAHLICRSDTVSDSSSAQLSPDSSDDRC